MKVYLLLLLAGALLAGCQIAPPSIQGNFPDTAAQLTNWRIKGRIGFSNGQDGGSANLIWQQTANNNGYLHLSGPLGFGSVKITYQPGQAVLDTGDKKYTAPNATLLAWRATGMLLPIPALKWWVRGLPWPKVPIDKQEKEQGHLSRLTQAGWHLRFEKYQSRKGLMLPGRIRAKKGDSRFTLLINQWARPLPE